MSATQNSSAAAPALLISSVEAVTRINFNRPSARNAINWELRRALVQALEDASRDHSVRVVVLAGDERAFCAGGDVKEMGFGPRDTSDKLLIAKRINQLISEMDKPVVAEVRGYASGAGFGLALACDFVLADESAIFQSSFIQRGLVPDMGTTYWLIRQVGLHRAKEIIFTGRSVGATEAFELGFVSRLWSVAEFRSQADALERELAEQPSVGLGLTKRMLNRALESDLSSAMDAERIGQLVASASDEHLSYLGEVQAGSGARGAGPR
jgi:2-(1,2-epoxy-1,2-dihydrophenyl)acetyl-CoA isomerase